jgi:hypothetical protein
MHLYIDRSSNLKKSTISNEIGTGWEGTGPNPPQQIVFKSAPPELYQQIERDGQRIFEDLGVNLQASQGASETGLESSGEARREARKTLDERNSMRQQRYEEFHLQLVRVALSIVRDIVENPIEEAEDEVAKKRKSKTKPKGSYSVQAKSAGGYAKIDFAEIAVDEENYRVLVKPASIVPIDPEGLKAHGQDMVDLGVWTPDQLAEAWQDLDIDGRTNSTVSRRRSLQKKFDATLYDGKPLTPPDEFTDKALAMRVGLDALALGEEDGVPDVHLEMLRRYLRQLNRLPAPQTAAPAAPGPAPAPPVAAVGQ